MLSEQIISDLVSSLRELFKSDIKQIILYGSAARNEATEDSDIDIALILTTTMTIEKRQDFLSLAAELDTKYEKIFSIIDLDWNTMEKWGNILPFYKNIKKEGIILWNAA